MNRKLVVGLSVIGTTLGQQSFAHHDHVVIEEHYHHPHVVVKERVYETGPSFYVAEAPVVVAAPVAVTVASPVYVQEAPPAVVQEEIGISPSPNHVWVQGNWAWDNGWHWHRGSWVVKPYHDSVWVSGRWERHPNGHVWVGGRWK